MVLLNKNQNNQNEPITSPLKHGITRVKPSKTASLNKNQNNQNKPNSNPLKHGITRVKPS